MTSLQVILHPKATEELTALAMSDDEEKQAAAAQLLQLIALVRSVPGVRDRLLAYHEDIYVRGPDGNLEHLNIRIIEDLKAIANDPRHLTDAVRRIKDVGNAPADQYRVFFAPRPPLGGWQRCEVLGVFDRNAAYTQATLTELKRRYENPK